MYIHWYFPWFSNKQSEKDRKTALCNSPRKKKTQVYSPSAQLCFDYKMIHSFYLKPLPIPVPASLKAMYVYKSKPHDPWDSRQYVRTDVSAMIAQLWSREHTKKQKSKPDFLPSGSEKTNTGTWQRRLDCHKGAAEAEPDGLHDCVNIRGPWNERDVKKQNTQIKKKRVVHHVQAWRLSQMCNSNYRQSQCDRIARFNADIRHWFACDCANSGHQLSMKAQLLKQMHWPQYVIKIRSVSSRPGQRTAHVKNLLLINKKIKTALHCGSSANRDSFC